MSDGGKKIIQGLKEAIAGDFARVTIDGQTWERRFPPAPIRSWHSHSQTIDSDMSAVDFLKWMQECLDKVKPECRAEARLDVHALFHIATGEDAHQPSLSVFVGIQNPTEPLPSAEDVRGILSE